MRIGTPSETKAAESRVGLTPASVHELVRHGHDVFIQRGAGLGIGASDAEYERAGARLEDTAEAVFDRSELIVKVKEPLAPERAMLRSDHVLFTYLHLAADPEQAMDLCASGSTCIAYETVTGAGDARLPLLAPMSKVAGRMATQAGAWCLESPQGGSGLLLGGVPGVPPARVLVLGGGVVGVNAAEMAVGLGAAVTVIDRDLDVLDRIAARFGSCVTTVYPTTDAVEEYVACSDLVIGAVLSRGARASQLVTKEMVGSLAGGSVLVDVAIDQGGCFETSRPTTHDEPTFLVDDVVHYCVANIPGAVPRTSTHALNNATLPQVLFLAERGARDAMREDHHLRAGLNVCDGMITDAAVADAVGLEYTAAEAVLSIPST